MADALPEAHAELLETMQRLERHFREMQDIEFTVEEGRLYLLQTRRGKRTAAAALRIAVDMVRRGPDLARGGGRPDRSEPARPAPPPDDRPDGRGRGDRRGSQRLARRRDRGGSSSTPTRPRIEGGPARASILVRWETTPDDIHGLIWAKGVLTAHGGMTSHAAVVARGMGKPAVTGCEGLSLEPGRATIGEPLVRRGRRDHDRRRHRAA